MVHIKLFCDSYDDSCDTNFKIPLSSVFHGVMTKPLIFSNNLIIKMFFLTLDKFEDVKCLAYMQTKNK